MADDVLFAKLAKVDDLRTFFVGRVAIGWNELDDLGGYDNFDGLYDYYKSIRTREKHDKLTDYDKSSRLKCGEVWAFLKKIKIEDFVVLPSKKTENIFIGKIIGKYDAVIDQFADCSYRAASVGDVQMRVKTERRFV